MSSIIFTCLLPSLIQYVMDYVHMTITYRKEELRSLLGPMVYMIRRGEEYLYIGATTRGLRRVFSHEWTLIESSEIVLETCADWKQARALEARLIREHQPRYNKAGRAGRPRLGAYRRFYTKTGGLKTFCDDAD